MSTPIHAVEFAAALGRCLPALARPIIAVANSAGPDSTCLLFLLRQLFPPHALLSLHVQHRLQPASPRMADTAAQTAHVLGIPHRTLHIPWGVPPFPPVPTTALERTARDARYCVLFHALTRERVPFLALGHHADDQLETAILRLARGSSLLGAAGMRPLRRWGMGSPHSPLANFGHLGLNTFIVRPLLPFQKDRIVATCHVNNLHFISDPTNALPHITPRNTIRHCLRHDPPFSQPVSFSPTASLSFLKVKDAYLRLHSICPNVLGAKPRLSSAVIALATAVEHVDRKVTLHLSHSTSPSPTGTLFLSSTQLPHITDPDVRSALILRVIRYISCHPWGSLRADADRRQRSIHRIVRTLWAQDPRQFRKFTAGAGVLWSPAIFNPNRSLRVGNQCLHYTLQPDDRFGWLASRIPPFFKNPQQGAGSPAKLVIDLTEQLRAAASDNVPTDPLQILYDCRFLLRIDPSQMPIHVKSALQKHNKTVSIKVLPSTQYYLPKVALQRESHPDQVLAVPQESNVADEMTSPSWISIRWVRLLDVA